MHRSVLIVEDDRDIRESLSKGLSLLGVRTIAATQGQEALEILQKIEPPCLILLDIMMPVMDGWQFRAIQKTDSRIADIPVIVITADGNAKTKARQMGVSAGMTKPFDLQVLFGLVRSHCHA